MPHARVRIVQCLRREVSSKAPRKKKENRSKITLEVYNSETKKQPVVASLFTNKKFLRTEDLILLWDEDYWCKTRTVSKKCCIYMQKCTFSTTTASSLTEHARWEAFSRRRRVSW